MVSVVMKNKLADTLANGNSHNVGNQVVPIFLCPSDPSVVNANTYGGCGVMQSQTINRDGFAACPEVGPGGPLSSTDPWSAQSRGPGSSESTLVLDANTALAGPGRALRASSGG